MFQGGKRRYTSSNSHKAVCLNFCFVYFLFPLLVFRFSYSFFPLQLPLSRFPPCITDTSAKSLTGLFLW